MMDKKLIFSIVFTIFIQNIWANCPEPQCNTDEGRNTLWAHENSYKFWQCSPTQDGSWKPVERDCAPGGIMFSQPHQVCVWENDWVDSCGTGKPIEPIEPIEPIYPVDPTEQAPEEITNEEQPKNCYIPVCVTDYERNTLFSHAEKTKFWQCSPKHGVTWGPTEMPCAPETWFCKKEQVCIFPDNWNEADCGCGDDNNGNTPSTTNAPTEVTNTETIPPHITEVPEVCIIPKCEIDEEKHLLWPHNQVSKFWQCTSNEDGTFKASEMVCDTNTWFCKKAQGCIKPDEWNHRDCGCCYENQPDPTTEGHTEVTGTETSHNPTEPTATPETCSPPKCETEYQRNTLWPHINPYKFWQCAASHGVTWAPVEKYCAPGGILFSAVKQVCVWPEEWDNSCGVEQPSSTVKPPKPTDPPQETTTDGHGGATGTDEPAPGVCYKPICKTEEERNTLFSHQDRTKFWQCAPSHGITWEAKHMPCAPTTWFCKKEQVCIFPENWNLEDCGCSEDSTTEGSTTEGSTPEDSTTEGSTTEGSTPEDSTTEGSTTEDSTTETQAPNENEVECKVIPDCRPENLMVDWPHTNTITFWRCDMISSPEGGKWERVQMDCDIVENIQYKFSFHEQKCVLPSEWKDACIDLTSPELCDTPRCTKAELSKKFPHFNPRQWYECTAEGSSEIMSCPLDQLYGNEQQKCVHPCDWSNICIIDEPYFFAPKRKLF